MIVKSYSRLSCLHSTPFVAFERFLKSLFLAGLRGACFGRRSTLNFVVASAVRCYLADCYYSYHWRIKNLRCLFPQEMTV